MPMSKKHYEADADAINRVLWTANTDPATVALIVGVLADIREADNPRFDRSRFYQACLKDRNTVLQPGWDAYKAERARLGV